MPPSIPSPSITVGDGKLSLKWAASKDTSGVGAYTIYRATGLGAFSAIATVTPPTLTYVDTGLTNYTSYRYYMTATDIKNQTSNASAIKTSYPKDLTGPAAVTVSGSVSDSRADLTWTAATDVSGIGAYRVYRAAGTSTTYSQVALLPPDARSFTHTGLAAGTSYRYLVRAVDTQKNLGATPTPLAVTTPTTGATIPTITHTTGTPGSTTTPVTSVITLRSTSASAVPVASAKVAFQVLNGGGTTIATKTATSSSAGTVTLRLSLPRGATYRILVTGVSVVGRTWDGATPTNSVAV
jgi:fibronectin type 3 domain-containing protein